jgi:hypothetical protein
LHVSYASSSDISRRADEGDFGALTSGMVKLVTGNTLSELKAAFLENPNENVEGGQVLCFNLQAGHSLDDVIDKQFISLCLVSCHTDEAQILRSRNP